MSPYRKPLPRRRRTPRGMVYLLHFHRPLGHAQHYVGFTDDLGARLQDHAEGNGARIMQVLAERKIGWTLARTWPDADVAMEYKLKGNGHRRRCPICTESAAVRMTGRPVVIS